MIAFGRPRRPPEMLGSDLSIPCDHPLENTVFVSSQGTSASNRGAVSSRVSDLSDDLSCLFPQTRL